MSLPLRDSGGQAAVPAPVPHRFFQAWRDDWRITLGVTLVAMALVAVMFALLFDTLKVRYSRDINRIVFNRNWELLDDVRKRAGLTSDSLQHVLQSGEDPAPGAPYIVVSIADRRLWYKRGEDVLFTTRVAVGTGKTLVKTGSRQEYKFDTPRGRLVVQSKETDPIWVPPDWHFVEQAKKKGLGLVTLARGKYIPAPDGTLLEVQGSDVVREIADGRLVPLEAKEGHEIEAGGNIVIPPYGTNQRKYIGVLGTHRLNMGDGYALHGTGSAAVCGEGRQPRLRAPTKRGHRLSVRARSSWHAGVHLLTA